MESADLGFLVRVLNVTGNGLKTTNMEVRVVRLTGEVKTQILNSPSDFQKFLSM